MDVPDHSSNHSEDVIEAFEIVVLSPEPEEVVENAPAVIRRHHRQPELEINTSQLLAEN